MAVKVKRVYGKISDAEILAMCESGELHMVDTELYVRGNKIKPTLMGGKKNGTRYRYEIHRDGCRRTIARSKCVFIFNSRRLVPVDYEIHHLDEDRYNDTWTNLICLHKDDHLKLHRWLDTFKSDDEIPF